MFVKCTTCQFDIHIHFEMIIKIKIINITFVVRYLRCNLRNFQVDSNHSAC